MSQEIPRIPLKWYERILVNSNKKLVKSPADRIVSIDWCKGYAIFWITYDHIGWTWLQSSMLWWDRFLFLFLYFFGPVCFLFFGGINATMSYRQARARKIPPALIFYETFKRMMGLYLIELGSRLIVYLAGGNRDLTTLQMIFQWTVLQTIAFSVILIIPLLKFSTVTRIIIGTIILLCSYPFYQVLNQFRAESIPAQILLVIMFDPYKTFNPNIIPTRGGLGCPLFPMFAFTIFGSVVIDLLLPLLNEKKSEKASTVPDNSAQTVPKNRGSIIPFKKLLLASLVIIAVSIIFGWGPNTDPFFQPEATLFINQLHLNSVFLSWGWVPQFILENNPWNIVFKLGVVMTYFLLALYYFDLRRREKYAPSWWTRTFSFFGQYSLSYYTFGFFFTAYGIQTGIIEFQIMVVVALIVLTLLFRLILRKAYGAGLVEFVMVTLAILWRFPPSTKDIAAVYPEKVAQFNLNKEHIPLNKTTEKKNEER